MTKVVKGLMPRRPGPSRHGAEVESQPSGRLCRGRSPRELQIVSMAEARSLLFLVLSKYVRMCSAVPTGESGHTETVVSG